MPDATLAKRRPEVWARFGADDDARPLAKGDQAPASDQKAPRPNADRSRRVEHVPSTPSQFLTQGERMADPRGVGLLPVWAAVDGGRRGQWPTGHVKQPEGPR